MTEQERQLKKIQLYQDMDLLEKDWLESYPLFGVNKQPVVVVDKRIMIVPLIFSALFMPLILWSTFSTDLRDKTTPLIIFFLFLIIFIIAALALVISLLPKYNKYMLDKEIYDKKRKALRRQYDAL
jgi:integral membrane sensor domain MASE1